MKVSLNWVKKYIDLPERLTPKEIAYDLTLKCVEVEDVVDTKEKFHDIVVGKILEVNPHPDADKLKVCMVDIGEASPVQIVCGGSNLYAGEMVVISKPGSVVKWHGEGEPIEIQKTKMRGVDSYGMICGAEEVYLGSIFPPQDEREIVDLKGIDCKPGDNIADVLELSDTILEIDNKSLTNRPDLWGHLGIARELSAIYDIPLKELDSYEAPEGVKEYNITIEDEKKCQRYVGVEIEGVDTISSPMWMQALLVNCGMRPINAIVDITNYVMLSVGQPTHAFDRTHIDDEHIIVRNAKDGEELLLLDDNIVKLDKDDLVIADTHSPLCLAGIKGGKKDSILDTTKGVLLEVANFTASTIRKSGKKFDEKTDSSIRYEKNIDTERVTLGVSLALKLFKELFPNSKIVAYNDVYPVKTERSKIEITQEFLDIRLGKVLDKETITKVLTNLGYEVEFKDSTYYVTAPVWRSTGDVSIKDDVLGDIARILGYNTFDAKPLPIKVEHAVIQNKVLLERRIKEYLANRCGFYEIYTYPWIDIKYVDAAKIDVAKAVKLATPPAPELKNLRLSLIPGMLEAISKNLRYFDSFRMFEMAQVFETGVYHESTEEEILPIHKKYLTGSITGKNAKEIFYELKGVLESISDYTQMSKIEFTHEEKPGWADINAYLNITLNGETIGNMGLLSVSTMNDSKIKHTNVAVFELDFDKLIPNASRDNKFESIPELPLVEKDLSILVDKDVTWESIKNIINKKVKELEFIEEYYGSQIPDGKKSITFRFKLDNEEKTLTSEEITSKMNSIINSLNKVLGAILREE